MAPRASALPYRESARAEPDPYLIAWAKLRAVRRARVVAAATLAACLAAILVAVACGALVEWAAYLAMAVTTACTAILFRSEHECPCPHCRTPFAFTNRCAACGILAGTPRGVRDPADHVTASTRRAVERDTTVGRVVLMAAVVLSTWPLMYMVQHWHAYQRDLNHALALSHAVLALTTASAFVFACARRIPSNVYAAVALFLTWVAAFGVSVFEMFRLSISDLPW